MPEIQRLGDANNSESKAKIIGGCAGTVFAGNKPVSVNGASVEKHDKGDHQTSKTANGSSNVFAENKPVNFTGNADTCKHLRTGGLATVRVNG